MTYPSTEPEEKRSAAARTRGYLALTIATIATGCGLVWVGVLLARRDNAHWFQVALVMFLACYEATNSTAFLLDATELEKAGR